MKKHKFKLLNFELFTKMLQDKTSKAILVIFLSVFIALPGSYLGESGAMRAVDFLFEDSNYQKEAKDDGRIVVISVDSSDEDIFDYGSINYDGLKKLITVLNDDYSNKPSVIGVPDTVSHLSYVEDVYDNVVFGRKLTIDTPIQIVDNSKASESFNAYYKDTGMSKLENKNENGYISIVYDRDGFVRHYLYDVKINGIKTRSFAETVYDRYCQNNDIKKEDKFTPPVSSDGFTMIPFAKGHNWFVEYSASDVLNGRVEASKFRDKIVILSCEDSDYNSGYMTAISRNESMYNGEIQANMIYNLLNERGLIQYSLKTQIIILTFVTWILAIIVFLCKLSASVIYAGVCLVCAFVAAPYVWDKGYSIHPLYYLATMIVGLAISVFVHIQRLESEQETKNEILNRYMDQRVRNAVLKKVENNDIQAMGEKKKVAIMFADLRNFTSLSSIMAPEDIVNLLNDFLSTAEKCIHNNGGTVDKFIGDCIMAFWEDVEGNGRAAIDACKTALEIVEMIHATEEEYYKKYGREISFGIGINYGEAIVGNIGSENRVDYTVIGETVNLASRLEAKAPKGTIFISEYVRDIVGDNVILSTVDEKINAKGFAKPLNVYILEGIKKDAQPTITFTNYEKDVENEYAFYVFGTRGSFPVAGRRYSEFGGSTTCFVLKKDRHAVIFDCGTGIMEAHNVLEDCTKIDVVLSHVHYDHILGLLSWLTNRPEGAEINFYGNFDGWLGKQTISELFREPFWPADLTGGNIENIHSISEFNGKLMLEDSISIDFITASHPNNADVFHVNVAGKNVCIMVDCEDYHCMPEEMIDNCDLLVFDGMYDDSEASEHVGWGHSTWQKAVEAAVKYNVGHLIVTHHNPNAWDSVLFEREELARKMFPNTDFARSGSRFIL